MRRLTESFDAQDVLQMPVGFTPNSFGAGGTEDYGTALNASNEYRGFSIAPAIGISWSGYYLYISGNDPAQFSSPFYVLSNGSAIQLMLTRDPSSALLVLRTGGTITNFVNFIGSTIQGTGVHPLAQGRKYHIQVGYNSSGTLEIRVDGIADIQAAGIGGLISHNTAHMRSVTVSGLAQFFFDSFYLNDDTGAEDNSWGGIERMKTSPLQADGVYTAWPLSPAVGTGFSKLTDVPNDGDTTHIYSNVDGQKSSFVPVAHGIVSPATIKAQTARWVIKKITSGQVIPFFRVGGADYPMPAALDLGVDYGVIVDRRTTNPATGVAWALGDTFEVGLESNI